MPIGKAWKSILLSNAENIKSILSDSSEWMDGTILLAGSKYPNTSVI